MLKQGAKPVARSKKRRRFEVFEPKTQMQEDTEMKVAVYEAEQTSTFVDVTSKLKHSKRNKTPTNEAF